MDLHFVKSSWNHNAGSLAVLHRWGVASVRAAGWAIARWFGCPALPGTLRFIQRVGDGPKMGNPHKMHWRWWENYGKMMGKLMHNERMGTVCEWHWEILWLSDFSVSLCLGKPTLCWMAENHMGSIVMGISTTYVLASFWHFEPIFRRRQAQGERNRNRWCGCDRILTVGVGLAWQSWLCECPLSTRTLGQIEQPMRFPPPKKTYLKKPQNLLPFNKFPHCNELGILHFLTIPNGENHFPPRINSHLRARYVCVRDVMLMATNSSSGVSRSPLFPLKSPATMH